MEPATSEPIDALGATFDLEHIAAVRVGIPLAGNRAARHAGPGKTSKGKMVGTTRIELVTPAMSTQCSTTELRAHAGSLLVGKGDCCKRRDEVMRRWM
jgi:hypothetical protein